MSTYACVLHPEHDVTIDGDHYVPACCGQYMDEVASKPPSAPGTTCSCGCRLDDFDLWWDTERTGLTIAVTLRSSP